MRISEVRVLLVLGLLLFILAPTRTQVSEAQQAPERPEQTSDQSPAGKLVLLHVTVLAEVRQVRGYVTELSKSAFTVLDNKRSREITHFSHEDEPLSIAVLLDLSGSMRGGPIGFNRTSVSMIRDHFSQFIQASNPSNEYSVIGFNDQAQLLVEGAKGDKALSTVSSLLSFNKPKGQTALYDACYLGVEKVTRGKYLKQAVLLFSDGQDSVSKHKLSDLRRLLKENAVMFLNIHIPGSGTRSESRDILDDFAAITGGRAFFPSNAKELIAVLNILATTLRRQYTLGFTPESNAAGDKWHRLKVEVKLPPHSPVKQRDIFVLSREGYYSAQ